MTVTSRIISRLAVATLLCVASLGTAQAAQTSIQANAKVVKSLVLTSKRNLDFGTINLSGAPGTYTVSLSQTGTLTCPSGATCAGTPLPAIMNVQGSNGYVVQIFVANTNLVNAVDGSTLAFTPNAPASITLNNSGFPGRDFNIGGSIAIPSTADGTYSGNVQVTVQYQ